MEKVYLVKCVETNKGYVGKTVRTLHDRWRAHRSKGSGCWALKGAIHKHGKDAFTVTELAGELTGNEAKRVEREMVHKHGTKARHGYNLTEGGQGSAHENPEHGKNIAKAWQRPETRRRHMVWRTHERMSAKANEPDTWMAQQKTWMGKRLATALTMPPLEASQMIWYKATKSREQAIRKGREQYQLDWMDNVRDSQILECWTAAGVPAPRASSWMVKSTAYEKKVRGRQKQWVGSMHALTKSRPSCASTEWDGELRWATSDEGE